MAQYGVDGRVAAAQVGDEASHGCLLDWRSRIGYAARWRETALIADADAVGIVATGMGSHALLGAAGMDHAVTLGRSSPRPAPPRGRSKWLL